MDSLFSLAIIGIGVSLLIQYIKQYFGGGKNTLLVLLLLSLIIGIIYHFLQSHVGLIKAILSILATAQLVYNYFIQWFEKPSYS